MRDDRERAISPSDVRKTHIMVERNALRAMVAALLEGYEVAKAQEIALMVKAELEAKESHGC